MAASERLIDLAMPIMSVMKTKEDYDRARRVERAIDNQGNPVDMAPNARYWTSPDGSVWAERIDNSGVLTTKKVS